MIVVAVVMEDSHVRVGAFEFPALPRAGDTIHVPWAEDREDLRIFTVDEVWHYAAGSPKPEFVGEDQAALLVTEIN
jgi:hypothetical protein